MNRQNITHAMKKLHLFRIALEVAKDEGDPIDTAEKFAESLDVSLVTLYGVMRGDTTSARVSAAIDAFIEAKLRRLHLILPPQYAAAA